MNGKLAICISAIFLFAVGLSYVVTIGYYIRYDL